MLKIALLAPAGAMHRYSGSFRKSLHYAPLTLTTLAALIPEDVEAEVTIYDETAGKHADVVFKGFSEQTFPQFIYDYINGNYQKFYHQNSDFTIEGRPIPKRELLNSKKYITTKMVEAIRGCKGLLIGFESIT